MSNYPKTLIPVFRKVNEAEQEYRHGLGSFERLKATYIFKGKMDNNITENKHKTLVLLRNYSGTWQKNLLYFAFRQRFCDLNIPLIMRNGQKFITVIYLVIYKNFILLRIESEPLVYTITLWLL